ncbi:MAG TPA: response regulator [Candidatus Binataceae bacterium]|nr:response regulator [Candidatus Binataceae bacterium]
MTLKDRIYWRSEAGERALTSGDPSVPSDYRRILRFVERRTHSAVIRGCLRQFPDALLADWLDELEEIGFLVSKRADITHDLHFRELLEAQQAARASLAPEDLRRIENQATTAGAALEGQGAFLSLDRLANRDPVNKKPREITVLIVEDDPDQAALAGLRVGMAGYQIRVAPSCREFVELLHTHGLPDLVLLDVMLPDLDGFEILASMRHHPTIALLPVILLTALVEQENIRRGLALGADGYITKPYSKKILTETIREVLKHC